MAVPKRKVSKARRDKRRSAVWNCGYYKGVEVIKKEA